MADDVLQFVDSVSATATVRLDMNDATTWGTRLDTFDFSPPPLRQARAGTLLVDGDQIPASSYGNRVLRGTFEVIKATIDLDATQIQLLNRELDRESNYLKWQPNGAPSPVFFRTLRSPIKRVTEQPGSGTYKTFDFEIEAEPFALGLREDVAPVTVNNDPAAGANGLFLDVANVKGDVATPAVLRYKGALLTSATGGFAATRQHGTPSDLPFFVQCESATASLDTTNPGGGPDAAMSGTGVNNFLRTSFATATMNTRVQYGLSGLTAAQRLAARGTFRVYAVVRRSDAVSVITVRARKQQGTDWANGSTVTLPLTTARQIVDLGLFSFTPGPDVPGRYASAAPLATGFLDLQAARASGAGTLDWDVLILAPADEQLLLWQTDSGSWPVIDGPNDAVYSWNDNASDIYSGSTSGGATDAVSFSVAGGLPILTPSNTTRFVLLHWVKDLATGAYTTIKASTYSITVSYWPRYLYIRPATT